MFSLNGHYFNTFAPVKDTSIIAEMRAMNPNLGSEIDAILLYNCAEGVSFKLGYSQFFATMTLKMLKGGSNTSISNWAYIMWIVRPDKITFKKVGVKM
jgi:hypothetical protein